MTRLVRNTAAAFAIGLAIGAPVGMASANPDERDFAGTVQHVSLDEIKVSGVEDGNAKTLGFIVNQKDTKLTHGDGKAGVELSRIRPGDTVKVHYGQRLLGMRHAETIIDQSAAAPPKT